MLENSKPSSDSKMRCSKFTTQPNLSKCTINNGNSLEVAGDSMAVDGESKLWPPTSAMVDSFVLKLKAKDGDMEANWEKIIRHFKEELDAERQLKPPLTSNLVNSGGGGSGGGDGDGDGFGRRDRPRAKFSVPLSRREMEKDFEDMGERRLPRKPKRRPKVIQNQLDALFPGLWLTEINADLYRVSDTRKRR